MRLLLPFLFLLGACVSVLPEPEVPRGLYQVKPASDRIALAASVTVREFEAPQLVSGEAMVTEGEDGALRLLRGAEWAGRLTRQMQLAVTDSFGPHGQGVALLPELGVEAPYRAIGRVRQLALSGNRATCDASVTLMDRSSRDFIAQADVRTEAIAEGGRPAERARALQRAAELCAANIARTLADQIASAEGAGS